MVCGEIYSGAGLFAGLMMQNDHSLILCTSTFLPCSALLWCETFLCLQRAKEETESAFKRFCSGQEGIVVFCKQTLMPLLSLELLQTLCLPLSKETSFGMKDTSSCISRHGWRASLSLIIPDPKRNRTSDLTTKLKFRTLTMRRWKEFQSE